MSATLDVKPLDEIRDRLLRDHITHGCADCALDEPRRQITVFVTNIGDLEQYAADLHPLILSLDVPRGIHSAPRQRVA